MYCDLGSIRSHIHSFCLNHNHKLSQKEPSKVNPPTKTRARRNRKRVANLNDPHVYPDFPDDFNHYTV